MRPLFWLPERVYVDTEGEVSLSPALLRTLVAPSPSREVSVRTLDPADLRPSPVADHGNTGFTVGQSTDGVRRVVRFGGELDLLSCHLAARACLEDDHTDVAVDLADTTFMDCCGFGGLVAARLILEQRGGSLTLRNQTGQPARLLALLRIVQDGPTSAGAS